MNYGLLDLLAFGNGGMQGMAAAKQTASAQEERAAEIKRQKEAEDKQREFVERMTRLQYEHDPSLQTDPHTSYPTTGTNTGWSLDSPEIARMHINLGIPNLHPELKNAFHINPNWPDIQNTVPAASPTVPSVPVTPPADTPGAPVASAPRTATGEFKYPIPYIGPPTPPQPITQAQQHRINAQHFWDKLGISTYEDGQPNYLNLPPKPASPYEDMFRPWSAMDLIYGKPQKRK